MKHRPPQYAWFGHVGASAMRLNSDPDKKFFIYKRDGGLWTIRAEYRGGKLKTLNAHPDTPWLNNKELIPCTYHQYKWSNGHYCMVDEEQERKCTFRIYYREGEALFRPMTRRAALVVKYEKVFNHDLICGVEKRMYRVYH